MEIDLNSPLSFGNSFRYPLQSTLAKRELIVGGWLVLLPLFGWILNMGHRIEMVHRMHRGEDAWPAWRNWPRLWKSGIITLAGMLYYYAPGLVVAVLASRLQSHWLYGIAALLLAAATIAIPGYMTHYCHTYDAREIFNPFRALRRAFEGGRAYWKAWSIALSALVLSFSGLFLAVVGFVFTSVWFWQVAGFSFACVFSKKFALLDASSKGDE